jgi:hypothetical protein
MGITRPEEHNKRMPEETASPVKNQSAAGLGETPAASTPDAAAPPSVRAQLLATEHWSLLASRSTTQAEVLTRISIFLTLTSAGLVSLALAGQAMRFDGSFVLLAITVLVVVIIVGQLTQIRVLNVAKEDLSYVLAMNRLRAAYTQMDPGILPYLMSSRFDDQAGSERTYYMLPRRANAGHVAGSSMVLIIVVNSALIGVLFAGLSASLGAATGLALSLGTGTGLIHLLGALAGTRRGYLGMWSHYTPMFPSEGEGEGS